MEALQKMLQTTIQLAIGVHSTAVVAQSSHLPTALTAKTNAGEWICDSGATDHMTPDINAFNELQPSKPGATVQTGLGLGEDDWQC